VSELRNSVQFQSPILPRDAMHKRSLCRRAVSTSLSVRVSVTFVYSVETSRLNISSKFSPSGSTPYSSYSNIPTGTP